MRGELMEGRLRIIFLDMSSSEAVEGKIRERATDLERFSERIEKCQVWVHGPNRHHRRGRLFDVRIRLSFPGEDIVVGSQPREEDVHVAIRNAFDAARRRLEDRERRRRGQTKSHRVAQGESARAIRAKSASVAPFSAEPRPGAEGGAARGGTSRQRPHDREGLHAPRERRPRRRL